MDKIIEEALNELDSIQTPISPEFYKIIEDFINDIHNTFPEYITITEKWWKMNGTQEEKDSQCKMVFDHCLKVYPLKMFDILKKNSDIFQEDIEFLPGINFKELWVGISDKSKLAIWNYLLAILKSLTSSMKVPGLNENIFDKFNQDEIGEKLEETMKNMHNIFQSETEVPNFEEHIKGITTGKIGKLAFELAEETAKSLNIDENMTSTQDIFSNFMKNPGKMMDIVKNMGAMLDEKMSNGEIDENEIMNEGLEMMNKMKDIPGFGDLSKLFGSFEMPNLSKSQKGAADTKLKQNSKITKIKERMNRKREKKRDPDLEKIEDIKKMLKSP
jgi:hypothetical protein